jgi:predicted RNase H-like HicB family nuclease
MRFHVTLEPAEDDYVVAECTVFPGCVSYGRDACEALRNMRGAIGEWIRTHEAEAIATLPADCAQTRVSA